MEEETLRHWEQDSDDRCPVCFVPPGAGHLTGECIYSGLWNGPVALPDVVARGGAPTSGGLPDAAHDVRGGDSRP
jgi:hypothetical protein